MTEAVFRDDPYARDCTATVLSADARGIVLDRTVFYARGGGQPGDVGTIEHAGGRTEIVETVKGEAPDEILHLTADGAALPVVGETVRAEIDWERRYRLMRMHSCLHLLSSLVPGAVTGGQVGIEKSRLDFDLPEGGLDKDAISAGLNRLVEEDHAVAARWVDEAELDANPELVKTMSVAPPRGAGRVRLIEVADVDLQACGGTHVAQTGEIGPVKVTKIENKGRQNRRVSIAFDE
jgi:misacylated tRNA(Ala) deacylase